MNSKDALSAILILALIVLALLLVSFIENS
jgi:hypothetical protein